MTNAPQTRKTHVIRIAGTNRDGEVLQDMWADVERMDVVKSGSQINEQWVGNQRKLRWCDDPNGDDYEPAGPQSRATDVVKVCDPQSGDVDDPDEWIPVQVIRGMRSRVSDDNGVHGQDRFRNGDDGDSQIARVFVVRKIVHYDTNIDGDAQAAFDADPTLTAYVVPGESYEREDSTKDDSQYIDHEIMTYFKPAGNTEAVVAQNRQTKLLNEYLIDESDDPDGTVVGAFGFNPPYRLDPFQNIININLGSLAVEFFDGAS